MKVGLVGPTYQMRSLPFDAQRTINLIPYLDPQGKDVAALYGSPGRMLFGNTGGSVGRAAFAATNGRAFVVSGSFLIELMADGTSAQLGTLQTSSGLCTIDENGFQLAVCDGQYLYIFTYASNAFAQVTDPDLPSAASVTFLDGYFICNQVNAGTFYISDLYNGLSWNSLQFATAESSPDLLLRVLNVGGDLWLFGERTTEVYSNTGASPFPFERINGARLDVGIYAPYSAISLDGSVIWIGRDTNGSGVVYRANGYSPQRISNEPEELIIQQQVTNANSIRTYSYQEEGHTYFVLTGGGMQTSPTYDLATQLWHERSYANSYGIWESDIPGQVIFAFNKHLALDRRDGRVYEQRMDLYTENGDLIARERTFTHLIDENQRFTCNNLTLGFETGVGTVVPPGADPHAVLYTSKDGGRTWSQGILKQIGKLGHYAQRVIWRRLGQYRQCTFRVRITSPVKVAISGSWMNTNG